jgi:hypothetical protein
MGTTCPDSARPPSAEVVRRLNRALEEELLELFEVDEVPDHLFRREVVERP